MLLFSWTLRSKYGRVSYFYLFYTILTLFFPSNFNRSTRSRRWYCQRVLKFTIDFSHKFWNVQSQYNWILPTQRIGTGIRRLNRRGRITPPAVVAQSRQRKPPASAKDLTRAQKTNCGQISIAWANSSLCFITSPSHPARIARNSNNITLPDSDKTIASQFSPYYRTRKLRNLASTGACWVGASSSPRWNLMKALQPSNQKMAGSLKLYKEPPNESSAVEWKSGSSGRGSIPSHPTTSTTTDGGSAFL